MQQFEEFSQEAQEETIPPAPVVSVSVSSSTIEALIEDYLDQVCAPMLGVMPYEARQKRRAEMRADLERLVGAHLELESDPQVAVAAALRQYGDVRVVASRGMREKIQTQVSEKRAVSSARPATLLALGLFGLPYIALSEELARRHWESYEGNATSLFRLGIFALPLVAGLGTGLLARHRPVRGVLNALGLLAIANVLYLSLFFALDVAKIFPMGYDPERWALAPAVLGFVGLTPWLTLGCGSAKVGSWLHEGGAKLLRRRRAL